MKKNVLFVDSDKLDRVALENVFKNESDFNLISVCNLQEAREVLYDTQIEVIVADYTLEDGSGAKLIKLFPDIPVIIFTSTNNIEVAVKILEEGAYDFLTKDLFRTYFKLIAICCHKAINRKQQEVQIIHQEKQIQSQEQQIMNLTEVVEQNPCYVLLLNAEGIIQYANPALLEACEYTPEQLMGKNMEIFIPEQSEGSNHKKMWKIIQEGKSWTGEVFVKTRTGNCYWELASLAPIYDSDGNISYYVKTSEDLTKIKKREQENIDYEKFKTVLEIAGAVSHELNQPLQIMMGNTMLLRKKLPREEADCEEIGKIQENIERLIEISKKLKNITDYKTVKYLDGVVFDIHNQPKKDE